LSANLGAFALRDFDSTCTAIAGLDVRPALTYPAVAVLHPRRHDLARLFPGNAPLPSLSRGGREDSRLALVYAMAFVREAGRVQLAEKYADRIVDGMAFPAVPPSGSLTNAGSEWLTWFQLGLTRLAAGELQQAHRELTTAVGGVALSGVPSRLTLGYLALVAALMGDTVRARHDLDRAQNQAAPVGSYLWGLHATARAIVDVEEHSSDCDGAIAMLDLIEDPAPFWPYALLARTRYAELVGRAADSLAFLESAELLYAPEAGSFAYDVLVARRIEALILLARVSTARSVHDDRAIDAPHCRVASLALLFSEHDFGTVDRGLAAVLAVPNLTSAQRVQAEALSALGTFLRDNAIPDFVAPGLGHALSLRAHRRVALMFPPLLRDALEPYVSADLRDDWQSSPVKTSLWDREHVAQARALTLRQVVMLRHLDRGRSYAEIAETEHVSVNTVKTHLKLLYKKLGVSTSSEALTFARRWGLLDS
uniref:helix-turn-helix transcriptional regulator n=1 Tax=Gordonia sp. (in: high G+C Gram-positive bacteria) TaxID=84139 RepID=UPI0026109A8D